MSKILEAAINDALIREIRTGFELEKWRAEDRHRAAAKEAHANRGHRSVGALGKQVLEIDARDWFRAREKFGPDCWHDKGFIKDVQRLEPDLRVHHA